jgi:hypothetical protein
MNDDDDDDDDKTINWQIQKTVEEQEPTYFHSFKKFPSYKFILLGGIFCAEFQYRSWLSVIILKVNIKIFLHIT